jgi:RNA polymerase sigma-70 factor (ECF subfamily)
METPAPATTTQARHVSLTVVRRAQRGDKQCREAVALHCYSLFRRVLARRFSLTPEEQEELAMETVAEVLGGLRAFAGRSSLETWAIAILLNRWRKWRDEGPRWLQWDGVRSDGEDDRQISLEDFLPADPADSPQERALQGEVANALRECLSLLSMDMRIVWVMNRVDDMEQHEIADKLRMPIRTVGTRVWRADRKLRKCLVSKGFG